MRVVIVLALIGAALAAPQDGLWSKLNAPKTPRVVGGVPADIEEFPFMSNLLVYNWFSFTPVCGGSLISPNAVLSAAHCFINNSPSSWRVRVGTSLTYSGGEELSVAQVIGHPGYVPSTLVNDIGVLTLSTPAVLSDKVGFATLPLPDIEIPDNSIATTVGFGVVGSGLSRPTVLQKADIYIINQEVCRSRYAYLKTIPEFETTADVIPEKICAGIPDVGGKDACQGDSGGPLLYNSILVGIVSWGHDCAQPYFPGVNTRVSPYYDWIVENAGLNED